MNPENPLAMLATQHRDSRWDRAADYRREERPCRSVRKLMIRGGVGVVFLPAPSPQLVVAGVDQNAIDRVQTRFSGDKLTVDGQGVAITVGSGANININGGTVSIGGVTISGGGHDNGIVALA